MMKRVTERSMVAGVGDRWRYQYPDATGEFATVQRRLDALGPKNTAKDVDAIIGNKTWTSFRCDGCCKYKTSGVLFQNEDYRSIELCDGCISKAAKSLRSKEE